MISSIRKPLDDTVGELESLKLLSVADVAKLTGFSESMIRRCTAPRGPLACVKTRSGATSAGPPRFVTKFRPSDVQRWIASMVVQPAVEASEPPS